jgi:hypothetical protein
MNTTMRLRSTWRSRYHVICPSKKRNIEANVFFRMFRHHRPNCNLHYLCIARSLLIVCKPLAESLCALPLRTVSHHLFHGYDIIAPQLSTLKDAVNRWLVQTLTGTYWDREGWFKPPTVGHVVEGSDFLSSTGTKALTGARASSFSRIRDHTQTHHTQ